MAKASTAKAISVGPEEEEWRAESDMNTLARAEEIKRDPKRLTRAKAFAKKKLSEMQAVAGTEQSKKE